MIIHSQRSDASRIWYDAAIIDNGDGTLTVPATTVYVGGVAHQLGAYAPAVGNGPFHVFVENAAGGVDYLLDLTSVGVPVSFAPGIGAPLVAWRDDDGGDIHILRSIPYA